MLGLALFLSLLAAPAGATGADAPFDRDEIALDESDSRLLGEKGYTFDAEGLLHAPKGGAPLSKEDVAYLLEDLRSHRRLADLLEIKLIQDRVRAQGVMTAEDRKALRAIGERDWPILSKSSKADLRPLFSDRELAGMDARAPKAPLPDASVIDPPSVRPSQAPDQIPLTDPLKTFSGTLMPLGTAARGPAAVPAGAPAAPALQAPVPAAVAEPTPVEAPAAQTELEPIPDDIVALPAPWATPAPAPASMPAPEPAPSAAPAPAPAAPAAQPDAPPPLPEEAELESGEPLQPSAAAPAALPASLPVPVPVVAPPPPAVPPPAVPAPVIPMQGFRAEPAAPPKAVEAPSPAPSAAVEPAPAPTPAVPGYPAFSQAAFEAFLTTAPYGHDEKALLSLLAADLPEPERTAAFGAVMSKMPHIVLDSRRAGAGRLSVGSMRAADGSRRDLVAVNDGPVMTTRDAFFGADEARFLPDDPALYAAWALPAPSQQAFSRESGAAGETVTKWGRARVYSDGSKRLVVTEAERAGALAHALLLLDSASRMPGDPYGAELRAWAGEFRFYLAMEKAVRKEPELSGGLLALYREWRERPLDFVDSVMHARMTGSSADARILDEAGLPGAKILPSSPKSLPLAGSEAERAWLDAERGVRSAKEDD